jgi:hypothetical protein
MATPANVGRIALSRAPFLLLVSLGLVLAGLVPVAAGQGIASGSVRGRVRSPDGASLEGAVVRVVNIATGFAAGTQVRRDRFLVQGLEPGGPYVVEVRHIGFLPQRSQPLRLVLGEPLDLAFVLQPSAIRLGTIQVSAPERSDGGTATTVPEALVHRLPTLNHNFYDFVVLAPQVSTKVGFGRTGVSGAGANFRFNNFLVNGADERFVSSNVSAAGSIGRSVPLEAVKEYQVLLAPYDVRYGGFSGVLINTITQAGTNTFRGAGFASWRNDRLARGSLDGASDPYERLNYGLSLGGPIVRDRVHFFVAPEIQRLTRPARGPYLGQPAGRIPAVPVSEADLVRLDAIMRSRYGLTAGSGGSVSNGTPGVNLFARVDAAIPELNSRLLGFLTHASTRNEQFSRAAADTFPLSSYQYADEIAVRLGALQLHTDFSRAGGGHNELQVSLSSDWVDQVPEVRQPLVRVLVPGTSGGAVTLNVGTAELAQGRFGRGRSLKLRDEISMPWGSDHVLTLGLQVERFRVLRGGLTGGYGIWTFPSLDALEEGIADRSSCARTSGVPARRSEEASPPHMPATPGA